MRRALRILITITKWAAIVAVAAIAIVVVINLFDESPTPAALALAEPHTAPSTADNAYFAFVGFNAPAGADPTDDGKRKVAEHDAGARANPWSMAEPGSPSDDCDTMMEAPRDSILSESGGALAARSMRFLSAGRLLRSVGCARCARRTARSWNGTSRFGSYPRSR